MRYEKPTVVLFDSAITTIQSHTAKTLVPIPDMSSGFQSNAAYEAEE